MHTKTSLVISWFEKDAQIKGVIKQFLPQIAKIERLLNKTNTAEVNLQLDEILDTHIPKVFNAFLALPIEQRRSAQEFKDGKTAFELFAQQLSVIKTQLDELYSQSLEDDKINFLAMHRKMQTVGGNSATQAQLQVQTVEEKDLLDKEGLALVEQSQGSWENGFKKPHENQVSAEEKRGLNPALFLLLSGGVFVALLLIYYLMKMF